MPEDKRQNEIIRIQKKHNNFVMLDKGFLEDSRLSYKAKGLLAYLLSKPDNWKVIVKDLINHSKDGKKAVYSGLKELKEYGYYRKTPIRDDKRQRISYWESVIYETLIEPEPLDENSLFTQNGKVEQNTEISTSYLFPPFVYIENVQIQNEDIQNRERNKNYISNIYSTDIYSNPTQSDLIKIKEKQKTDMIRHNTTITQTVEVKKEQKNKESYRNALADQSNQTFNKLSITKYNYTEVEEIIKTQINYDYLKKDKIIDQDILDEIIFIVTTTICTEYKDGYINMGEERVPAEAVKSVFFKLSSEHIEYFIDCFNRQTDSITKLSPYIRKSLYYNYGTVSHYYTNRVHHDMPQLVEQRL